jgi:branched-chain amino acid transport system substrate-binding protein
MDLERTGRRTIRRLLVCSVVVASIPLVSGVAGRSDSRGATAASCGTFTLGVMAPITGAAASIGIDQLHWPEFFATEWNRSRTARFKLKFLQGDDQLDPAKASTIAQQFASTHSVVGVIGPPGSSEASATAPIFIRGGLAFVSGSATAVSLTNGAWRGYFFRVVPNDAEQGPTVARFMTSKLGVRSGDDVMVVDDQESYSTGLADIVQRTLAARGVHVDRESIAQNATDFSSLVAKVKPSTKVVYLPFQLASEAQLFVQQMREQGKKAIPFGSDGTFDVSKFNVDGAYVSFFAPDITTIPRDAAIVKRFHEQFPGNTSPFGVPNYIAAQVYATAISSLCAKHRKVTRASVRAAVARVRIRSSLFGPIRFTRNGDVVNARFHIFKVVNGKYVTVQ